MNNKQTHYAFAAASFFIAFIVYLMTMQPTVPFWDCGEFAGAAWALQVPHPPGSPLWTLVGRFAMMVPSFADPVARYNLFSVLSSAGTIMILYLTVVRLAKLWRGEPKSGADILTTYGGAFIGALAFTFTDSFWFNALECEVYAFGSLFIALVPWIMLVWYDHAEEEHNEKYMLLAAYVIGLSMGVHQLALLTIFPSFMLIYYRRRNDVTISSWLMMAASAVVAFLIAYKVVLSKLVEWWATMPILSVAVIAGCAAGIWYSHKQKKAILNLSLWASMLLFLGYTTYTFIIIRANQDPPMNQNAPKTFAQMTRYINREQYGSRDFMPRRYPDELGRQTGPTWNTEKYPSDGAFFWKYQTDHMFNRYLYWNFIGRAGEEQDTGTDWSKTWGIPFLLGAFGLFWHFKRDKKRALAFLGMFILLGWMTAWYQNQQEPQPRERDYFYVGAFYVYALWVGIGAIGLMELARAKKKKEDEENEENEDDIVPTGEGNTGMLAGVFALALLAVPVNMCVGLAGMATGKSFDESSKWAIYSREANYIPFDYAYNILQTCEKDAILFTFGDNDTFPLWCLQDVYGIRRDIRIVQLSLSNIGWYINQLKNNEPWGAKKVLLPGFTTESLLVAETDPLAPRIRQDVPEAVGMNLPAETVRWITGDNTRGDAVLSWKYTGTYNQEGQYLFTVADQLSLDIIKANINTRPIYYSVTVPDNYRIGLDRNLIYEGMAMRITPDVQPEDRTQYGGGVNAPRMSEFLMTNVTTPSSDAKRGMILRTYNDPNARFSYLDKQYAINYFLGYMRYASAMLERNMPAEASKALETLDKRLPPELVRSTYYPADVIADLYERIGNPKMTQKYAAIALGYLNNDIQETDPNREMQRKFRLANLYVLSGKYDEGAKIFEELKKATNENGPGPMTFRLLEISARKFEAAGNKQAALAKYDEMIQMVGVPEEQMPADFQPMLAKRNKLRQELGVQ
jgi:tetratricopeptide (TPR) repeat protein